MPQWMIRSQALSRLREQADTGAVQRLNGGGSCSECVCTLLQGLRYSLAARESGWVNSS